MSILALVILIPGVADLSYEGCTDSSPPSGHFYCERSPQLSKPGERLQPPGRRRIYIDVAQKNIDPNPLRNDRTFYRCSEIAQSDPLLRVFECSAALFADSFEATP